MNTVQHQGQLINPGDTVALAKVNDTADDDVWVLKGTQMECLSVYDPGQVSTFAPFTRLAPREDTIREVLDWMRENAYVTLAHRVADAFEVTS